MKLGEIKEILEAEIIFGDDLNKEINKVAAADLMSDMLTFVKSDALLLTGLTIPQVIRTAEVSEVGMICFVRGKKPPTCVIDLAKEKEIPLLVTKFLMYEACGKLYTKGIPGCEVH